MNHYIHLKNMNLVIGNSSQLFPYFKECDPDIIGISSRNIDFDKFTGCKIDRAFLTFAEQRTFLNEDVDFFIKTNVDYTVDTIVKLAPMVKTFIVYSTSELWNGYTGGITVDMPFNNNNTPYIRSKELMEYRINMLRIHHGIDIKIVYPFNFNSPYRKEGFLFSKFMSVILHGEHITVGDLNFTRDIVHPKLIVDASLNTKSDIIVGSGNLINIRQYYIDLLENFSINYMEYVTEQANTFINTREPYYFKTEHKYNNLLNDTIDDIRKFKNIIS